MIHRFSCKNFCSFKEATLLNFDVNNKAPKNLGYLKSEINGRVSKIETIIGPNASGKTNLMKVLPFLKWILVDSFSDDPKTEIPLQTFAFRGNHQKPAELSVVFEMNKTLYTYEIILNNTQILFEQLSCKNKTIKRKTNKTIFIRRWSKANNNYYFNDKKYGFPNGTKKLLRTNSSLIASAIRVNHKLSQEITDYWDHLHTNVVMSGYMDVNKNLPSALFFYSRNESFKKKLEKMLSIFDLGSAELMIKRILNEKGEKLITADLSHLINGKRYNLPITYESSGTKKLIVLLEVVLRVLSSGGIAVLDEIDVNLHPEIVIAILSLFIYSETNPHNAQLLFSTHSHLVLNRLGKNQIVLTKKNPDGSTIAWRLDEDSNVRADENYYAKYVAGAYVATPNIDL
jgi:AAA15 family ATPase/GTPase